MTSGRKRGKATTTCSKSIVAFLLLIKRAKHRTATSALSLSQPTSCSPASERVRVDNRMSLARSASDETWISLVSWPHFCHTGERLHSFNEELDGITGTGDDSHKPVCKDMLAP